MRFFCSENEALRFYTAGNLISKDGFLHQRRVLDCNVLIYVLDGTLNITQSGSAFSVSKGQYILLNAYEEHFGSKPSDGHLSYLWVHFTTETPFKALSCDCLPERPENALYMLCEYGTAVNIHRVSMLFKQLIGYSRQESLYSDKMLTCSLSLLLMELTQQLADTENNTRNHISPVVYAAGEWIKSNCHRHSVSISEIAEEFHYSPEYFSAMFRKETGETLIGFLNRTRIEISKNLLSCNDISIKEAAYSSGFNDEKYYMRLFKKHEGITPMQFKNSFHKS